MKRIIVCLDGTWNTAEKGGPTTNVVAIRDRLVATLAGAAVPQRIYYDEGVGTGDPLDKLPGGGLGFGLGQKVRQAYKYISRHYTPGDEIYLIGFSRGAFTARSVAGYIAACGLLTSANCTSEREAAAWRYYRTASKARAAGDEAELRKSCHANAKIKCVAVFDTVGALGIPGKLNWIARRWFAFHETQLSKCVENCFHAVSIDEKRMTFVATMWEQPFNFDGDIPNVQQAWFPGVHGDVGGGYSEDNLSRIALEWVIGRLASLGVAFDAEPDPGPAHNPSPAGTLHESRKLPLYVFSWIWPRYRPINGIVAAKGSRRGDDIVQYRPIKEYIHRSALDRWKANPSYRPINLGAVLPMIEYNDIEIIDNDGSLMAGGDVAREYADVFAD